MKTIFSLALLTGLTFNAKAQECDCTSFPWEKECFNYCYVLNVNELNAQAVSAKLLLTDDLANEVTKAAADHPFKSIEEIKAAIPEDQLEEFEDRIKLFEVQQAQLRLEAPEAP